MRTYWLRLYPQQPLQLDDPNVIPSRALRGALIAVLQRDCIPGAVHDSGPCNPNCVFWPVLGTSGPGGGFRVGNAYAARQGVVDCFPASAKTCGLVPGFRDQGGHGVVDVVIRAWVFERAVMADPGRLLIPFEQRCTHCGADLIRCDGWLAHTGEREWRTADRVTAPMQSTHRSARAINTTLFIQWGTILDGSPDSGYYMARADVPESLDAHVREALDGGLVVGGGRTHGRGVVRAELVARPDPTLTTRARIAAFNQALRAELRFYGVMANNAPANTDQGIEDGAWYFALDVADMHLSTDRQPDPLAEIKSLREVRTVRRWIKLQTTDGRNTATAKRSGARQMLSGTFLCRAAPDADRAALEQALAYLETHGIGMGSERGYGNVTVCDPFHLESDAL